MTFAERLLKGAQNTVDTWGAGIASQGTETHDLSRAVHTWSERPQPTHVALRVDDPMGHLVNRVVCETESMREFFSYYLDEVYQDLDQAGTYRMTLEVFPGPDTYVPPLVEVSVRFKPAGSSEEEIQTEVTRYLVGALHLLVSGGAS